MNTQTNTPSTRRPSRGSFARAWLLLPLLAIAAAAAMAQQSGDTIDRENALALRQKQQQGLTLTLQERADLEKAIAARRGDRRAKAKARLTAGGAQ